MDLAAAEWGIKRSVTELGRRLDESTQTIHHWAGERGVSRRAAEKCQRKWGWSSTWILDGVGPQYVDGSGNPADGAGRRMLRRKITVLGSIGSRANGELFIEKFPPEYVPSIAVMADAREDVVTGYVVDNDELLPRYRRNQVLAIGEGGVVQNGDDVLIHCRGGKVLVRQFLYPTGDTVTVADLSNGRQSTLRQSEIETMEPILDATRATPGLIPARTT